MFRPTFRLSSYVSTIPGTFRPCYVLDRTQSLCFDHARGMFRPCSRTVLKVCFDSYVSTVVEVCFDHPRGVFRPCSKYISTVLELCFDHTRGLFRLCSRYVSTVLELCFDRGTFRPCSKRVLNVCFDRTQSMFPPCSR